MTLLCLTVFHRSKGISQHTWGPLRRKFTVQRWHVVPHISENTCKLNKHKSANISGTSGVRAPLQLCGYGRLATHFFRSTHFIDPLRYTRGAPLPSATLGNVEVLRNPDIWEKFSFLLFRCSCSYYKFVFTVKYIKTMNSDLWIFHTLYYCFKKISIYGNYGRSQVRHTRNSVNLHWNYGSLRKQDPAARFSW